MAGDTSNSTLRPRLYEVAPRGGSEGIVRGASSLPPLKSKDGKYGLLALLLLLGAGGLWYFTRSEPDPEPQAEANAPTPEAPAREQFPPEIEIPPEEELEPPPESQATPRERPRRAEPMRPEELVCTGTINPAQVRAAIQGAPSKQVQTCYERGLKTNNLLQGSMQLELTIGAGGIVRDVSVTGTLNDAQVYSCVRRVARTWKFPSPTGGCVRINAPFQMTPKL